MTIQEPAFPNLYGILCPSHTFFASFNDLNNSKINLGWCSQSSCNHHGTSSNSSLLISFGSKRLLQVFIQHKHVEANGGQVEQHSLLPSLNFCKDRVVLCRRHMRHHPWCVNSDLSQNRLGRAGSLLLISKIHTWSKHFVVGRGAQDIG